MKWVYALIGVILMGAFFAPIVFKLSGERALLAIVGLGFALMIADLVRDIRAGGR